MANILPYITIHDRDRALTSLLPRWDWSLVSQAHFFAKSCTHCSHVLSVERKTRQGVADDQGSSPVHHQRSSAVEKACASSTVDRIQASLELRRHFCSRANVVLASLNRYLNTIIPSPAERNTTLGLCCFYHYIRSDPSALPFKPPSK